LVHFFRFWYHVPTKKNLATLLPSAIMLDHLVGLVSVTRLGEMSLFVLFVARKFTKKFDRPTYNIREQSTNS
jgi:hypothetical protein